MKKMIFASSLMICGLLLVIIMIIQDALNWNLNFLGNCFLFGGVIISIVGTIFGILNLDDKE